MPNNRQIVQNVYEAFARGDCAAVIESFDPAIVWLEAEGVPYARRTPFVGVEDVAEHVIAHLLNAWEDLTLYPELLLQDGDIVIALGHYRGRYRATGRRLDSRYVHVWTVRGSRVTRFQQCTDTAGFRDTMAVRPGEQASGRSRIRAAGAS